ncbi:MAG: WYL domain-containing protein [Chloroflexi bacterium]|nr:WYL domain-containing protein [Chloroflexota bacterium]
MSCTKNAKAAAGTATKNGIPGQSNKVLGLAGQSKQIIISDPQGVDKTRYIVVKNGGNSRMTPLDGQMIKIDGPAQIVSTAKGTWWIETGSELKTEAPTPKQQPPEPGAAVVKKTKQIHEAVKQRRQIQVSYRTAKGRKQQTLAPLDVENDRKTGKRYLWGYADGKPGMMRLSLDKISAVKPADKDFDPEQVMDRAWGGKKVEIAWNLPRAWRKGSVR